MNLIYKVFLTTQLDGFSCTSTYSSFLFCKCQQIVKKTSITISQIQQSCLHTVENLDIQFTVREE